VVPITSLDLGEWLRTHSPDLAELYQAAVKMLSMDEFPARQILVCHCVREIANRLPNFVAAVAVSERYDATKELGAVREQWYELGLNEHPILARDNIDLEAMESIVVPISLFNLLNKTFSSYSQVQERNVDTAYRLFEKLSKDENRNRQVLMPLVLEWRKLVDWFVKKVHVRGNLAVRDTTSDDEFRSQFQRFEGQLTGLASNFFEGVKTLDEILEDTNSPTS
jgi:hypothetical protein